MARVIDTRRSRLLLAGLVLSHVVIISQQIEGGGGASLLERVVFSVFSPFQRLVAGTVRGVRDAWTGYVDLRRVREENAALTERLRTVETQLQERQHQAREAERLRELLDLRRSLPIESVVAEIVAREGLPWFSTFTINKGSENGVRLNDPVISPSGVVGRVIGLGPRAAKIQLILDVDSGVGVVIERSRVTGVLKGQAAPEAAASGDLPMKYVPALADVEVGDVVVTSGLDQIYPKGLVVGRVSRVSVSLGLVKDVMVTPSARFPQTEEVLVLRVQREEMLLTERVR